MVCCKAFPNVEIWQRVDFVGDRERVERSVYGFKCPVPVRGAHRAEPDRDRAAESGVGKRFVRGKGAAVKLVYPKA